MTTTASQPSRVTDQPATWRPNNWILARLPEDEWNTIRGLLRPLDVERKASLLEAHQPNNDVYFVDSALVSVVGMTASGQDVEVAMVGCEGVLGIAGLLGRHHSPFRAVAQMPGRVYAMSCGAARHRLDSSSSFRAQMFEFLHDLLVQSAQAVVCNRFHTATERLARWLLMADDRVRPRAIELTQEFLAEMLGVPRTWLTRVAGQLQDTGLIAYRRGVVTIVDRPGLLHESCECYELIRSDSNHVPGRPSDRQPVA